MRYLIILVLICTCLPGMLHAQQGGGATQECSGLHVGFHEHLEPLRLGHIVGKERIYLLFPLGNPYLVTGDVVVVVKTTPDQVCVAYPKNDSDIFGWLPANRVKIDEPTKVPTKLNQWIGTWRSGKTQKIIIRRDGDVLRVEGHAWWQGSRDPHFGDLEYTASPVGNTVTLGSPNDYDCQVQLLMLGHYIAAQDNQGCGGTNVSFSGFYVRRHK